MAKRVYLLITALLLILPFSLAEASIMGTSTREPIGAHSWSVTIPAMNTPSTAQRIILAESNQALGAVSTTRGKVSENESPRPQDRVKLPKQGQNQGTKQGKSQPGNQNSIFDRWGN